MSAAWIIFNNALHQLAGQGAQRARLASACSPAMLSLKRKEVPQERREEFDALLQLLGAGGHFIARDIEEAVAALTDAQMAAATHAILSICDQLTRYEPLDTHLSRPHEAAAGRRPQPPQPGAPPAPLRKAVSGPAREPAPRHVGALQDC
jgi:hypothetical protein